MNEAEAKKILEETFNRLVEGEEMKAAREKYAKLKVRQVQRKAGTAENLYQTAYQKLGGQSEFLSEEAGERLILMTGSGFGQRNPTVVELEFAADNLTATAWAKEGFIPQKSADKAIDMIFTALQLN